MAESLIESLSGDFVPEQYADNYREALQALIEAKVAGREVVQPAEPTADTGTVVDLMAALRASVEAAKANRAGGQADDESVTTTRRSTPKKAAKAPAKRAATRRKAADEAASTKETRQRAAKKTAKTPSKQGTKRASGRKSA